jgi:hypothetical protein
VNTTGAADAERMFPLGFVLTVTAASLATTVEYGLSCARGTATRVDPLATAATVDKAPRPCRETAAVIMVLDIEQAEADLAAGVLACPRCAGRLRPWSWAPTRRIRQLDGAVVALRPRRTRCAACHGTHLLLPAWCLPRRADAVEVIGAALVAHAAGHGHRSIAAALGRPVSTVRRWLRAVRGEHGRWLYRHGVEHASRFAPEVLGEVVAQPSELGDALTALAAAVLAFRRRFARRVPSWTLVGIFTRGQLLTPAPSG